jgi:DNA-binding CsgD family transcriptional regulator
VRARATHVRGTIELAAGTPATACALLADGARLMERSDPRRAVEVLVLAARAALTANQLDRIVQEIAPAVERLPGHDLRVRRVADSLVAAGLIAAPTGATARAAPAAALERLRPLSIPHHPAANPAIALLATRELVEAAARAGQLEDMEAHVARLERWAEADRRPWTQAIARRCRALVSQGEQAERHFLAALAVEGIGELPQELARTELLYGEWLRRERRRSEARAHLRVALELFERLDGAAWAWRARSELRASGETARKRDPSTLGQLTVQERRVARLAGRGLTNQQIAERLFVSRYTVGYHLRKVYAKLGITSRAELSQLDLTEDDPR